MSAEFAFDRGACLGWSDDTGFLPAPRSVAFGSLLDSLPVDGGSTLVVGPMHRSLLQPLANRSGSFTWLIRGENDASAALQWFDRDGASVRIVCGGVEAAEPGGPFDTVIALDGFDRAVGFGSEPMVYSEIFAVLRGLLAEHGRLVVGFGNPLADWLVADRFSETGSDEGMAPSHAVRDDGSAWMRTPAGISGQLPDVQVWSAHPTLQCPTLLHREPLTEAMVLAHHGGGSRPFHARRWMKNAFLAGLADTAAAGWVAVVGMPDSAIAAFADAGGSAAVIRRDAQALVLDEACNAAGAQLSPVPAGRLFETELVAACDSVDIERVHSLVRAFWAAGEAGVFAHSDCAFDNLVIADDGIHVVYQRAQVVETIDAERRMRDAVGAFAAELVVSGLRHPWPDHFSAGQIAAALAAVGGVTLDPAEVNLLDASVEIVPHSFAEQLRTVEVANVALRDRIEWFEGALATARSESAAARIAGNEPADGGLEAGLRSAKALVRTVQRGVSRTVARSSGSPEADVE